ncbi:MAG TPA: FAD/NAD(P)-binding protein [Usitatibacter sp.]|nr:FAD/NAD(P)-binding protein [Usitatibacter sp.]
MGASRAAPRIAIVGGGFSAASFAVQLARASAAPLAFTVLEPRPRAGPGLAYSSDDPDHRLNGAIDTHGLDPAEGDGLEQWCRQHGVLERDPEALAPNGRIYLRRSDFGAYLADAAPAAVARAGSSWRHVRDLATGLRADEAGLEVLTRTGSAVPADFVAIATGNGGTRLPGALQALALHPAVIVDPLNTPGVGAIEPTARVLVVGSGLTALDTLSTLVRRGHRGSMTAISRHGLRPRPQRPPGGGEPGMGPLLARIEGEVPAFVREAGSPLAIRALTRALRRRIDEDRRAGENWYRAFDDLRDVVWQVWPTLAPDQKARFLRWLRPWYDMHRFRSPPQNDAMVMEAESDGRIRFETGHLQSAESAHDGIRVGVRSRDGERWTQTFDVVVNCTGLDPGFGARDNPFLAALLAQGVIRIDDCGIGFAVDGQCRPVATGGAIDPRLRIVGPPTAGTFGDPLGVLFIGPQIRRIVPGVLADLGIAQAAAALP